MLYRVVQNISNAINRLVFKVRGITIGENSKIYGRVKIIGSPQNIIIGDGVVINSGYLFNPLGGNHPTVFVTEEHGKIVIGNNVGISNCLLYSVSSIKIEDEVMIGGGTEIYDTDFHAIQYCDRIKRPNVNVKSADVKIEKGAFIGAKAIVLKGVTIGEKSVVGAGAVITKRVPSNEIWAGNPAHKIGCLIDESFMDNKY